jgi:putative Holliday junction resolvase
MSNGKRIAFDYGSVRIGVATSDSSGIIASPLELILNDENSLAEISKLFAEISPIYIAVGIPKQLSGSAGTKEQEVMNFINRIKGISSVPIYGIDERLTTVTAAAKLRESGRDARGSKELIDSAAAVGILEVAMEHERAGGLSKCAL